MDSSSEWVSKVLEASKKPGTVVATTSVVLAAALLAYNEVIPLPLSLAKRKRNIGYLFHPSEFAALIRFKFFHTLPSIPQNLPADNTWCFQKLFQTSRSFAAVIMALTVELREPVCIFYLVLRGLDTIEDDMKIESSVKVEQLRNFYVHLREPGWNVQGFGDNVHEIELLENFDKVISVFCKMKPKYQEVISDICQRMGEGMAEFVEKSVDTVDDYELYCHYVAGLVGHGLTRLFVCSEIENNKFANSLYLANSMGLFLQKTNIIRDLLEDISEEPPRVWYPKEIWGLYTDDIQKFKTGEASKTQALSCLNHMITDALKHVPDCLTYMSMIQDPTVFRFCGIPQVMAIATLCECYNNYDVFRFEVKIRKGLAVQLILECVDFATFCSIFARFASLMKSRIPESDPHIEKTTERLTKILTLCHKLP